MLDELILWIVATASLRRWKHSMSPGIALLERCCDVLLVLAFQLDIFLKKTMMGWVWLG